MTKKVNIKALIVFLVITLGVGALSGFFTKDSMDTYSKYSRPLFSPPGFLFPIVWTILFVLMAISAYIVYHKGYSTPEEHKDRNSALFVYFLQLVINFLWPIIFFRLDAVLLAAIWLGVLIVVVIYMTYLFYKISQVSAYLLIPYILWLAFAAYLNIGIYVLNK